MDAPMVSILMTSYNREAFIAEAIESVLASTYQHFELIITDNCSTDKTTEIADRYAAKDARIRVYKNKENIGQFPNRNYAASLARGEYLKYLDSDDKIYPFGLAILVKRAVEYPEAGLIISTPVLDEKLPYPELLTSQEAYRQYFLTDGFPSVGPSFILIKKTAFDEVKGFTVPSYAGTDTEFLLRIAALYPVVKAEYGTVWYRQHEGQEIQVAFKNYEYELQEFRVFSRLLNDANCPLTTAEKQLALEKLKKRNIRRMLRFVASGKIGLARKLYQEVKPSLKDTAKALNN
jgi:glycosyltransferase involved in cell wall biosynthesis